MTEINPMFGGGPTGRSAKPGGLLSLLPPLINQGMDWLKAEADLARHEARLAARHTAGSMVALAGAAVFALAAVNFMGQALFFALMPYVLSESLAALLVAATLLIICAGFVIRARSKVQQLTPLARSALAGVRDRLQ